MSHRADAVLARAVPEGIKVKTMVADLKDAFEALPKKSYACEMTRTNKGICYTPGKDVELAFDALFYVAHRGVHAVPSVYRAVHKLHHSHTHDLRRLSALQMSAADVVLTHTLPVLGALALVPLAPGLELSVAKTYLLFQELYGHAGCEHRGRCFGPAPWLTEALGIELRAADHQRHHVQGSVNFSKRFSLFDRLFGTWADGPRPRGLKVIDLAEAPADAYPVD